MSSTAEDTGPVLELEGTVLLERYRVDKLLGRGGMGAVFRGHQLTLKRDVAIKVLHPDLTRDDQLVKRFEREAQSTAVLEHPNIVRVLEFGQTDAGHMFIVMQLLEGHELDELIGEPFPITKALGFTIQILRALDHAHRHGIVHRDLKPENVFVVRDDEDREVLKLVDFGIAKIVGGQSERGESATPMTKLGLVFGTPQYMSPEQATGMETDARTDLYSTGLMLYAMLAGHPPFQADDPIALIRMQVGVDPPPLPAHVPPAVAAFVMRLVAKNRDERFASASEARKAAEALVAELLAAGGLSTVPELVVPAGSGAIDLTPVQGVPQMLHASGSTPTPMPLAEGMTGGSVPLHGAADSGPITATQPPTSYTTYPLHTPTGTIVPGRGPLLTQFDRLGVWRWPAVAGAGLVLLALVFALARRGEDADPDDRGSGGGDAGAALLADYVLPATAASEDELAEIDRFLSAKNSGDALGVIQPLLDANPGDPVLLWRAGKALALNKKSIRDRSRALHRYFEALGGARVLLKDPAFFAELHELLRDPKLRDEAVNLALRDLGEEGHPFLLEKINEPNPSRALGYVDRHRIIDALMQQGANEGKIDWDLNLARDLWQARRHRQPCTVFEQAIDDINARPSPALYERLLESKVPKPGEGEVEIACTKAEAKLSLLLTRLEQEYSGAATGGADAGAVGDEEGPTRTEADPAALDTSSKSSSSKSSSGKSGSGEKKREKNPFKKGFWK